jgi:hypothetical protein
MTRANVAPVLFRRCPLHNQLVTADGEGRLLTQCQSCAAECARGFMRMSSMPKRMTA